jgi:hypothetical protein
LFNLWKSKPVPRDHEIRDALFGDRSLAEIVSVSPDAHSAEPWASYERARKLIDAGESKAAADKFQGIVEMPQLESRHYLQAWHFLRELGVPPPAEKEKDVLGVVVEVGMEKGLDLVAAYADHHARYYNFSGAGVVWERPNDTLDAPIDDLLRVGSAVVRAIGPWQEARPGAPAVGVARINLLTPSGLHFGEGPINLLGKDRMGGAVLNSAFQLMQELIKLTKK